MRVSKDGIPFMYHDNSLNPRLAKGLSVNRSYIQRIAIFSSVKEWRKIPSLALLDDYY
jgi:hypothetical protein